MVTRELALDELRTGNQVERYVLIENIGLGGQATIWSAWDNAKEQVVALKFIPVIQENQFVDATEFEREAHIIASLEHPNILPLYAFGALDNYRYLAMRYISSGSLLERIEAKTLEIPEVLRVFAQVTSALEYMHARNVIHRDIKPGNVLLDTRQRVYLTDFGLARDISQTSLLLHTGHGTAPYAPPEQHVRGEITVQSDIYSLGILLYVMLVGRLPWDGATTLAIAQLYDKQSLPDLIQERPELPASISTVLQILTASEPANRPDTARTAFQLLLNSVEQDGQSHLIRAANIDSFITDSPTIVPPVSDVVLMAQDAEFLFEKAYADWTLQKSDSGLSYSHFTFVNTFYKQAEQHGLSLDDKRSALLLQAALTYGDHVHYWWQKVGDRHTLGTIVEQFITGDNDALSERAIEHILSDADQQSLLSHLSDSALYGIVDKTIRTDNERLRSALMQLLSTRAAASERWSEAIFSTDADVRLIDPILNESPQAAEFARLIGQARSSTAVNALLHAEDFVNDTLVVDALDTIQQTAGSIPQGVPLKLRFRLLTRRLRRQFLQDQAVLSWTRAGIGLLAGLLLTGVMLVGWFAQWDAQLRDILMQPYPASGVITIVEINDDTLDRFGRWDAWPRSLHADLITQLSDMDAGATVLDIAFASETPEDDLLAEAIQTAGNVVIPVLGQGDAFRNEAGQVAYAGAVLPQPEFTAGAAAVGQPNILHDDVDGYIRELPLLADIDGETYPSLVVVALQTYLGLPADVPSITAQSTLQTAGRTIPVGEYGEMLINYAGPPAAAGLSTFNTVSYEDVLDGEVDPDLIENKIVLIGITATAEPDRYLTPVSEGRPMYGVEILANAIETIWQERFTTRPALWARISIILFLCGLVGIISTRPWLGLGFVTLIITFYLLTMSVLFDQQGVILDLLYPIMGILVSYITVTAYRYSVEVRERRQVMKLFEDRVTPEVARATLKAVERGEVKLGGQVQEVSVLFADIRGYTAYSETHPPDEVMEMINSFMTIVAECIFSFEGTLANYEGDQAMALFNAPLNQPDHAWRAVRTVLNIQSKVATYQANLTADHPHHAIDFGYGVYTGRAIVGYSGSTQRYEYTALGDTINVAARLTAEAGPNQLLIGESTFERVQPYVIVKPLPPVAVKGKVASVPAYVVVDQV